MMDDGMYDNGWFIDDLRHELDTFVDWRDPKIKRAQAEKAASDLRKAQAKAGARDRMTDCRRFIRVSGRRG